MKKILSLFAFAAIVLTFAACGGNDPEMKAFRFNADVLSTKAHIVVTPSVQDLTYFVYLGKASEVTDAYEMFVDNFLANSTYPTLKVNGYLVTETYDRTPEKLEPESEYILLVCYVTRDGMEAKRVGEVVSYTFVTPWDYELNGVFSISRTDKVHFATSNMSCDANLRKFYDINQYTYYGRETGDPYDLLPWSWTTFFSGVCMTREQWWYLFRERPNAEKLFAHARVHDVNGLILLPDNWAERPEQSKLRTSYELGIVWNENVLCYTSSDINYNAYEENIISDDNWSKLELAGAVFLPAAGGKNMPVNMDGFYWSKTEKDESTAYGFCFSKYYVNFWALGENALSYDKNAACSIRGVFIVQ